jgi:ATP-dependent DNA helicase UvrD/PcrA
MVLQTNQDKQETLLTILKKEVGTKGDSVMTEKSSKAESEYIQHRGYVSNRKDRERAIEVIKTAFPGRLNEEQIKSITTIDGPVQIIAGPGSGKTAIIALRALYLVITGEAEPREIVLTTFTKKAASHLKDILSKYARLCNYDDPALEEMRIGTIDSLCNSIVRKYAGETSRIIKIPGLTKRYIILDRQEQHLFLNKNFIKLINQEKIGNLYFGRWYDRWSTIMRILQCFDTIAREEEIDLTKLANSGDLFKEALGRTYEKYRECLLGSNRLDYAHLEWVVCTLLDEPKLAEKIRNEIKFILVDEYQDTNYVQEQIFFKLARPSNNLCVVGDPDQAIFRFRGATIRNILEFDSHFKNCCKIELNINYRNHPMIVRACDDFMQLTDWSNFRVPKKIRPDPDKHNTTQQYPATVAIEGISKKHEGRQTAQLIKYLKDNNTIKDYSEIAVLLRSVKSDHNKHLFDALKEFDIPYIASRARKFSENEEIQLLIGYYAMLFDFAPTTGYLKPKIDHCISQLRSKIKPDLENYIQCQTRIISNLQKEDKLDMNLVHYFNNLLEFCPFYEYMDDQNKRRNLGRFKKHITTFQEYYDVKSIDGRNKSRISDLFDGFLRLLDYGVDDYGDKDAPTREHVQIMTIHQSKGLEFPVVIVGVGSEDIPKVGQIERDLSQYYQRDPYEPENRINDFDSARLYYVAFSRAANLLVLTYTQKTNPLDTQSVWVDSLGKWPILPNCNLPEFDSAKSLIDHKKLYSPSLLDMYETCPKKYEYNVEDKFPQSKNTTLGTLVHDTIEDIHDEIIQEKLGYIHTYITNESISLVLRSNYEGMLARGMEPISIQQQDNALDQVLDYFNQNYDTRSGSLECEKEISTEKPRYILKGKIDLLVRSHDGYKIIDFKTGKKPEDLTLERRQLLAYAYILTHNMSYNISSNKLKLYLYWTKEQYRENALMEIPFSETDLESVGRYYDSEVNKIQNGEFKIEKIPDPEICSRCDFRKYCSAGGIIKLKL